MVSNEAIEAISGIQQILDDDMADLHGFMNDSYLQEALDLALVFLVRPDVPPAPQRVAVLITQLSAYSLKFRTQYVLYMGFKKGVTNAAAKKNTYRAVYDGIDNLVDSLKYLARQ